ncbi:MAG: ribokinase [Candidatus Kryptonium sp.]|nr:ribokinase [Candidatus Kryptonium sp.]
MVGIVGSSNYDIVLYVEDFTLPGVTQKALNLEYFPGGKGANQAVCVAKLSGRDVFFLTCIGNDQFGNKLKDIYLKLNIKGFVQVDTDNGLAFIEVNKSGENRIIIYTGANDLLSVDLVRSKLNEINDLSIILLQNEIPTESTLYTAMMCKEMSKTVIFDPAPATRIPIEIVKFVDYITPNETELRTLSNEWFGTTLGLEEFYNKLLKINSNVKLIVKQGSKGIAFLSPEMNLDMQAFNVNPVDTTAAGDVFNGAFAVALDEKKDIFSALRFASASAALSVTKKGAQTSIPSRQEVEEFLKSFPE